MRDSKYQPNSIRRIFLQGALLAPTSLSFSHRLVAQTTKAFPRPDPSKLQAGDFVWPKKPGAYVPYNSGSKNNTAEDRNLWAEEKEAYLSATAATGGRDALTVQRMKILQQMDYREFIAVYAGAQAPGQPGVYSGGAVYVGHVGMIDIDSTGEPWVIEALLKQGVVRSRYDAWLAGRAGETVWLGRLRNFTAELRAEIPRFGKRFIGSPYDFWNFDLDDDSGFYCSKLAWLCCNRTLHMAVDGDPNTKRLLWFSPKQFLYQKTIEIIHDPGPYAYS